MWSNYIKVFTFRDCFEDMQTKGNIRAINELLTLEQFEKNYGAIITTDIVLVSVIMNNFKAFKSKDDGIWNLYFSKDDEDIAVISLWNYKEIQLCFEIEEEVETGEFKIHCCVVKGFKEYNCD